MALYARDGGTTKKIETLYVRDYGENKPIAELYENGNLIYQSLKDPWVILGGGYRDESVGFTDNSSPTGRTTLTLSDTAIQIRSSYSTSTDVSIDMRSQLIDFSKYSYISMACGTTYGTVTLSICDSSENVVWSSGIYSASGSTVKTLDISGYDGSYYLRFYEYATKYTSSGYMQWTDISLYN
ncbi:MAG: hypothetical protein R3Y06_04500 [Faecalibacterium sp.]